MAAKCWRAPDRVTLPSMAVWSIYQLGLNSNKTNFRPREYSSPRLGRCHLDALPPCQLPAAFVVSRTRHCAKGYFIAPLFGQVAKRNNG